jgi:hypothetical protein
MIKSNVIVTKDTTASNAKHPSPSCQFSYANDSSKTMMMLRHHSVLFN